MLHFFPFCSKIRKVITVKVKYNIEALKHIITDLSCLTGISIAFLDSDFNCLFMESRKDDYCSCLQNFAMTDEECKSSDKQILLKCRESRKLESHICHAGLCDSAMPIIKNGIIAGYVIFGRICTVSSPEIQVYTKKSEIAETLNRKYHELTFFSEEQIKSIYDLLPRILFQDAIEIVDDSFISEITDYINNNLSDDLKISILCKKFFVSKNRLYEAFKNHYGCTVNDYITEQKIKKASLLLKESSKPIYSIAESLGFDNYTYFCKLFKKKTGFTPSDYRASHRKYRVNNKSS